MANGKERHLKAKEKDGKPEEKDGSPDQRKDTKHKNAKGTSWAGKKSGALFATATPIG